MCEDCDSDDDGPRPEGINTRLIPAARQIEAGMPGNLVLDEAWTIFSGRAGGGVAWVDLQRMLTSYEAAEKAERLALGRGRKRRTGRLRCEAATSRFAAASAG